MATVETKALVSRAVAALEASDFSGKVGAETYVTTKRIGNWAPYSFANPRSYHSGGAFEKTGTRTEIVVLGEAAANLADDPNVKFVSLETKSRIHRFRGPLLTVKREHEGQIVTDQIPLNEGGFALNGHKKLVDGVLRGIPSAVQRRP
jgi:hypothetical protein